MVDQNSEDRGVRFFMLSAALVIIIWGVYQAQPVVVPLLVSVFLAIIGMPAVAWLRRKGIPNFAAVLIIMVALVAVLAVFGMSARRIN